MRSAVAVATPAFTSRTICSIVNPCAIMIASVQPSREASNSSARRRSGFGRRRGRGIGRVTGRRPFRIARYAVGRAPAGAEPDVGYVRAVVDQALPRLS